MLLTVTALWFNNVATQKLPFRLPRPQTDLGDVENQELTYFYVMVM
jgi:hypothetical protein